MRLTPSPRVNDGARLSDWSLDLASSAMAVRTLVEIANDKVSAQDVVGVGATYLMLALAAKTFWVPPAEVDAACQELYASQVFSERSAAALAALERTRDAYFAEFNSFGIEESVMRNLIGAHPSLTARAAFDLSRATF